MLDGQLRCGVSQVVVLGAGLDTRAVRKPADGVTCFEIDDAATLAVKQDCYQRHGIDANVRFIPGNYVTAGLTDLLEMHGFDANRPTYFIWDGNTMYLPVEANKRILAAIRRRVRRFRVSFDYMAEEVIAKTTGDPGITRLVESFAAMGAPWLSGFRDMRSLAKELHLTLIERQDGGSLSDVLVGPSDDVPNFQLVFAVRGRLLAGDDDGQAGRRPALQRNESVEDACHATTWQRQSGAVEDRRFPATEAIAWCHVDGSESMAASLARNKPSTR